MTGLPLRILTEAPDEPVLSVDGAFGAAGLNLSHWPGNTTPDEFRHDLSTGSALVFAKLPAERRAELLDGLRAVVNNHVDTDGVCALFAVLHPELAVPREEALLAAAEAGDFFHVPTEDAFVVDAVVTGLIDAERSPWRADWTGASTAERHEDAARRLVELLPALLDGDVDEYRELWEPQLEALRADRRDLAEARHDDLAHFETSVWTAGEDRASSRTAPACEHFNPCRHALFSGSDADRVLAVGPKSGGGATYRFLLSTKSWFDLTSRPRLPRPDLETLARRLNELEGTRPEDELAWRAQPIDNASPEVWFGRRELAPFAPHNTALAPSRLEPKAARHEFVEAVRAVWTFPED